MNESGSTPIWFVLENENLRAELAKLRRVTRTNAAIAALQADGTLDALNKKWFLDYKMN